ncbi:uncharacterized protein LOC130690326 [Daphnia carinata]|uniref:uncharacterized protein LOC130690326 n=1 Tax=Daphnia carinata TaxID=120202 RepID=UPI00258074D5|nr:uncharacterized protein LOC130690326 [Daphnia carinata]
MKIFSGTMVLMSAIISISPQYFHQHSVGQHQWWLPYYQQPHAAFQYGYEYQPTALLYPVATDLPSFRYSYAANTPSTFFREHEGLGRGNQGKQENWVRLLPTVGYRYKNNPNEEVDVMPRIKSSFLDFPAGKKQGQEGRLFYFNSDSSINPFLKTVTLRVTSTCTSLSIISCIPAANLPDAPIPACRRRRDIEMSHPGEDGTQFSVNPSKVQPVTPTAAPWPVVPRDSAQISSVDVISSKELEINNSKLRGFSNQSEKPDREARFIWKHQFTSTTTTSWSVVSSTLTQTFVPAADLACLPPGYVVC